MPFILPPAEVQLVPTVNEVLTLVQRSTPCAQVLFDSRKVVLQTMRTFMVRVRVKEVFMDTIIGFRGPGPWIRIRWIKPSIKVEHILMAVNRINTFESGKYTISNVPPMALIWRDRSLVTG
jgi:hypothetical protein